ncbi:glycogen/starch synthase [Longimonas halophila]|nr:glycogen/starch synthase [Longimonas halophila]
MAQPTRILYIAGEMEPFTDASDLSTLVRTLAEQVQDVGGHDVRVFMPKFGAISDRRNKLHEVIRLSGTEVPINGGTDACTVKVASVPDTRVQVYFMEHEEHVPETPTSDFPASHALFFNRAILETVVSLRWIPDVVHGFGWQSALFPALLEQEYLDHEQMTHRPRFVFTPDASAATRALPESITLDASTYHELGVAQAEGLALLHDEDAPNDAVHLRTEGASEQVLALYDQVGVPA